ncbi:hypothetical protein BN1723_007917 [Verticillium longisporum]|uniref:Uncharacterized protein n=1 Tax=Verticillium longisporum TaxID=100787 RepID=A0A0G4NP19_VERLO|nr:hypothetical protein BN1723_007917 [Verticillium longisporum]
MSGPEPVEIDSDIASLAAARIHTPSLHTPLLRALWRVPTCGWSRWRREGSPLEVSLRKEGKRASGSRIDGAHWVQPRLFCGSVCSNRLDPTCGEVCEPHKARRSSFAVAKKNVSSVGVCHRAMPRQCRSTGTNVGSVAHFCVPTTGQVQGCMSAHAIREDPLLNQWDIVCDRCVGSPGLPFNTGMEPQRV